MFDRIEELKSIPKMEDDTFQDLMTDLEDYLESVEDEFDDEDEEGGSELTSTQINKVRTHASYLHDEYEYDKESSSTFTEIEKILEILGGGDNE
jgi:hypothetical protein